MKLRSWGTVAKRCKEAGYRRHRPLWVVLLLSLMAPVSIGQEAGKGDLREKDDEVPTVASVARRTAAAANQSRASRNSRRVPLRTPVRTSGARVQVAFDDFEGLDMQPFDEANKGIGDGTDWLKDIPGWFIENAPNHVDCDAEAYNGWSLMDVDSWIAEQGPQGGGTRGKGRTRFRFGRPNNTALIADPDAWDDFPGGRGNRSYNSYVGREYDVSDADLASLQISFDWDFVTEDWQIGVVEVSFDQGASWQLITAVASARWKTHNDPFWGTFWQQYANDDQLSWSTNPEGDAVQPTQKTFVSGVDFFPPEGGAETFTVRFGCIESGNDWWFAVDNVELADSEGVIEFEDFEYLADDLLSFLDGGVGVPPGDGTDYTQFIPSQTNPQWIRLNDGTPDFPTKKMYNRSREGAYDGWAAVDAQSWTNEQGGQERTFFLESFFPLRNTVLLADPDAHEDYPFPPDQRVTPPAGEKEFNAFIERTYDLSNFQNTTVRIEMDWETRLESTQRSLIQVSFDGGASWVTLLDADTANINQEALLPFLYKDFGAQGVVNSGDVLATFNEPQAWEFGGASSSLPALNSNTMKLRFGLINARNNWWFAVDNIKIEAVPQNFKSGDANFDGLVNFNDIDDFLLGLFTPDQYLAKHGRSADEVLDFNADGVCNFNDINGFLNVLFGN